MANHITLLGSEAVEMAARNMQGAADRMQQAANQFDNTVDRLARLLDEHASRIENALQAHNKGTT